MKRTPPRARRVAPALAAALLVGAALLLAACTAQTTQSGGTGPGFFPSAPASQEGALTSNLYTIIFIIATGVFVLVEGLLLWIVLRYRRRPTDAGLPPQTHGSNALEILWTLIPAIIVTGLFVMTVDALAKVDTPREPAVTIDVTGFQFQWTFEYEREQLSFTGAGTQGPVMALPINETVRIRLHGTDVIHSFYVPQFLYKRDVVPGRVNQFEVVVEAPGTYTGQCAEFCGLNHADMFFTVQAMTRADFDAWVAENQQGGPEQPTPPPDAPTVRVTSVSTEEGFNPTELTVAPDTSWVVELTNVDTAAPHDFAIRGAADGGDWQGDPDAPAGGSAAYQPPPLPAGTYEFYCSIHPQMTGTLHVGQ